MLDKTLPRGLAAWHPAVILASWFGSGFLPKAPGTWGSLAALPFAWLIARHEGARGLALAAAAIFAIGWLVASIVVRRGHHRDPPFVVVDEVAGQWLSLIFAPLSPWYYALGFVLFRIADIAKPWPASYIDRAWRGGFAVMADDVVAGLYALAVMWAATHVPAGLR